ncbi:Holliday junction branch migration DNA helicase RuvB [Streptomyces sp. NPDC021012]|uniref:Holliday junction branch migration DNA helicase RuvB n=1 Tax=Streptomyces sp. NPDC021012 TaxID=3365107 RepID=UPI00378F41F2
MDRGGTVFPGTAPPRDAPPRDEAPAPGRTALGRTVAAERAHPPVAAPANGEDRATEAALRPKDLDGFIGQERVREQLDLVLRAARQRSATADHVLLSGAPGLGKTTLAMIIAAEMGAPLRMTSGPAIQHPGDLAAVLASLTGGEVLFLDEIHRMSRPAEEMLYLAMEDFRVDIVVGTGIDATAMSLELPPFTLVGATVRAGMLLPPLRDRFGFTGHMEFYEPAELERVIHRSARLMEVEIEPAGAAEIAGRSRGTPRIANRLLRRVRDYAQVTADGVVTREIASAALGVYEVDGRGLDRLDQAVLHALLKLFGGGPVGLATLAVAVGEERETVEEVAEPFLVREGLLARTPRGRVATPAAWAHLGLLPPPGPSWTASPAPHRNGDSAQDGPPGARTGPTASPAAPRPPSAPFPVTQVPSGPPHHP